MPNKPRDWVFDLDNTLYPASCDLFAQIDGRMTEFVSKALGLAEADARALQKRYYADHGTTLNGLMTLHDLPPADFLDYVHDIDLSPLPKSPALADAIADLPGRKFIFTNGSRGHAGRVSAKLGLSELFDGVFAIEDAAYQPKPHAGAYRRFGDRFAIRATDAVFFEDMPRNLAPAHALGYTTVLVHSEKDWSHEPADARPAGAADAQADHVHHATGDLVAFLREVAPHLQETP